MANKYFELVTFYKIFKGYDKIPNWDKINFNMGKNISPAKRLLELTGGDEKLARQAIEQIGYKLNELQMKSWTLNAIVRNYDNWFVNIYTPTQQNKSALEK